MELYGVRRALSGRRLPPFNFDPALCTFTPGMAKRAGGVFAGALIVQGDWDGSTGCDVLSFVRGAQIQNAFYANFDPYQGGGLVRWTPEQSSADRTTGYSFIWAARTSYHLSYDYANNRYIIKLANKSVYISATVTAGTPEYLAWGFDADNKLDGTNYLYFSRNDAQTYGVTVLPTAGAPNATIYVGGRHDGATSPSNGIIEGLVFTREIPWNGAVGTDMGQGDIVAAHAAGNDVSESIGSWGVTFSLPTNATKGPLVTGNGEAWSHPHASVLLGVEESYLANAVAWNNWTMEGTPVNPAVLAAAERVYNWGYKFDTDANLEGYYRDYVCVPGEDFVIRAITHCSGGTVRVILYDQTGGATIGYIDGASNSRTAPNVHLFAGTAPAGCVLLRVKVINLANPHTTYVHQVELYNNRIDNPSLEGVYAGVPPIPPGWVNVGLDAGDCQASSTGGAVIHSGSECVQFNAGATNTEYMRETLSGILADDFFMIGIWLYSNGAADPRLWHFDNRDVYQRTLATGFNLTSDAAAWTHKTLVARHVSGTAYIKLSGDSAGPLYADDLYAVELDPVSLTVVPANLANSTEASGIRVDGDDTLVQPIPAGAIRPTRGRIRWRWTPRHDAADLVKFIETAYAFITEIRRDPNNRFFVRSTAANTIALATQVAGAGWVGDNWDCTGAIVAAVEYLMEVRYVPSKVELLVDGTVVATATRTVDFGANVPNNVYWGLEATGTDEQGDGNFAAP